MSHKKCFIGRSISVYRSALSEPNGFCNITSAGRPIEWGGMLHRSAKESNREQEGRERRDLEKTRRSAPARVGGSSSYTLWVRAFSRDSENAPALWRSLGGPFSRKGPPGCFSLVLSFAEAKESTPKAERSGRNNITIAPNPNDQAATISLSYPNQKLYYPIAKRQNCKTLFAYNITKPSFFCTFDSVLRA